MTLIRSLRQPDDPFRDFCQWDYDPVTAPDAQTLRQSAFLLHALNQTPEGDRLSAIFRRLQQHWGAFNTVWGVKSTDGALSWELYFYDYDRLDRRLGIAALQDCLPELVAPGLAAADQWPWFMFSVEFDTMTSEAGIASVDLYFEHDGGTISAGLSEVWDGYHRRPKNDYRFYRSAPDRAQILRDLSGLPPLPGRLQPGRFDEEVFVISRKSHSSAVYFSRVPIRQTLLFAQETGFNAALTAALAADAAALAPYRFDLGIDYCVRPGGSRLRRSAIYGIF